MPFKCYIYCTLPKSSGDIYLVGGEKTVQGNGKVIGEFVCDKITELAPINRSPDDVEERACLTRREIVRYLKGRGYAWHISDLVIYNKPKELREFYSKCDKDCPNCEYGGYDIVIAEEFDMYCASRFYGHKTLKRPPQSWCYVKEVS